MMEYATLNELCTIQSGGTPSRSQREYWSHHEIPWLKISDMKEKYISTAEEYISEEGLRNSSAKIVQLTDKSKVTVLQSITTLQTLKAKLMQEYFG